MHKHSSSQRNPSRLNWRDVGVLYGREMRAALREKAIVLNSLFIPVFLYPLILWAVFSGITFVMGQSEGFRCRAAIAGWPAAHPKLRLGLEHDDKLDLAESTDLEQEKRRIKAGELDALLQFLPASGTKAALPGNFEARITYDSSRERSNQARRRLSDAVERHRQEWLNREARQRGIDAVNWQGFTIALQNVASKKQMGAFILGLIAPVLFVVMVAVGCFYPAIDCIAGERERNTWETLMSTSASRLSVVTAKYLYVASMGGLAGILNLLAIAATMRPVLAPLMAHAGQMFDYTIVPGALPMAALGALLLAGFVAAGMMIFASFARTFKEGQAMITPFYTLTIVPIVFLQVPGIKFTLPLACVPIANVTMMMREALSGVFHWPQIALTVASSLLVIALCLRLATFLLQFEDIVLGSFNGSLNRFIQQRLRKRRRPRPAL
jgi:sodium transport system permease protein